MLNPRSLHNIGKCIHNGVSRQRHNTLVLNKYRNFSTAGSFENDLNILEKWKSDVSSIREEQVDNIHPFQLAALSTTLDRNDPFPKTGDEVPPSWHLTYLNPLIKEQDLASDGYEKTFSPPDPFSQRVWAGSFLDFHRNTSKNDNPLRVGQDVKQITSVDKIDIKKGSKGYLAFVTVKKEISNQNGLSITEKRTLAYMRNQKPANPKDSPSKEVKSEPDVFERRITPSAILLFRYSALTFNSHRIHYDYKYATQDEGYPGLLVHGPLTSTLLLDHFRRKFPGKVMASWNYRALTPLFDHEDFFVCGKLNADSKSCELWARNVRGVTAMSGTVTFL